MRGLRLWGVLSSEVSCPPRPVAPTVPVAPPPVALAPDATQADKDAAKSVDDTALADYDRKVQDHSTAVATYRLDLTEYTQWIDEDARAAAVLTSSVLPQYAAEFMGLPTAAAQWAFLRQRYQPSGDALYLSVVRQEHALQQGDSTIDEFYTQSAAIWRQLDSLRTAVCATCPCCLTVRADLEFQRVFEFLSRLRKEFEPRRAQLLARGRVPLSEVLAELRAEETRLRGAGLLEGKKRGPLGQTTGRRAHGLAAPPCGVGPHSPFPPLFASSSRKPKPREDLTKVTAACGAENTREKIALRRAEMGNSLPEGEIDAIAIVIERDIISIIIIIISTIYTAITTAAPRHRCNNSGISMNEVRKKLFTISLSGKAAHWYKLLKNGDSIDWEDIVPLFYSKFYPPNKTLLDTSCSGSFTRNKEEFKRDLLDRIQENTEGWENDKDRESGIIYDYKCIEAFMDTDKFRNMSATYGLDSQVVANLYKAFASHYELPKKNFDKYHEPYKDKVDSSVNKCVVIETVDNVIPEAYIEKTPFPAKMKEYSVISSAVNKSEKKPKEPEEQIKIEPAVAIVKDLVTENVEDGHIIFCEDASNIVSHPNKPKQVSVPMLSVRIGDHCYYGLCDIGASVSAIPYELYTEIMHEIGSCELEDIDVVIHLANRETISPIGIVRDVEVLCGKIKYPADFLVLGSAASDHCPIIFGRPFLNTCGAIIDCKKEKILTRFAGEPYEFNFSKFTKTPYKADLPSNDFKMEQCASIVLVPNNPLQQHLENSESEAFRKERDELEEIFLRQPILKHDLPVEDLGTTPPPKEDPVFDLKPLPDNLKYAHIDDKKIYPVIISSKLSEIEEESTMVSNNKDKGPLKENIQDPELKEEDAREDEEEVEEAPQEHQRATVASIGVISNPSNIKRSARIATGGAVPRHYLAPRTSSPSNYNPYRNLIYDRQTERTPKVVLPSNWDIDRSDIAGEMKSEAEGWGNNSRSWNSPPDMIMSRVEHNSEMIRNLTYEIEDLKELVKKLVEKNPSPSSPKE
ncbi:hypothetical protein QYE76_032754 [Lolium multiflorum]|uniref:Retrotransposon gag domain-containing protein n=1 Tax=Lolium multiflorum TaxID=4521 RepID=A0AAD8VKX7_LOLMU|nr:hypothetical protein QYE76_032754 [Lolium multiflorum]